jgi:hypothetical protein
MSYLKMALKAMEAATCEREGRDHTPPAKPAKLHPVEPPQASPEAPPATCELCLWFELNPWTSGPALGAWCHYRMEHLVVGSGACGEFRRGEVPPMQPHKKVPAVPATMSKVPQERILTCEDCHNFEPNNGPNPLQGWGKCLKRNQGRYGCATACEEVFTREEVSNAHLKS